MLHVGMALSSMADPTHSSKALFPLSQHRGHGNHATPQPLMSTELTKAPCCSAWPSAPASLPINGSCCLMRRQHTWRWHARAKQADGQLIQNLARRCYVDIRSCQEHATCEAKVMGGAANKERAPFLCPARCAGLSTSLKPCCANARCTAANCALSKLPTLRRTFFPWRSTRTVACHLPLVVGKTPALSLAAGAMQLELQPARAARAVEGLVLQSVALATARLAHRNRQGRVRSKVPSAGIAAFSTWGRNV